MFSKIEAELIHIITETEIEKLSYSPNKEIRVGKISEAIYEIKFEDIERIYVENPDNIFNEGALTIIVKGDEETFFNTIVMNGIPYKIIMIYTANLNKDETNSEKLCNVLANYAGMRLTTLLNKYQTPYPSTINTLLMVALPIIVCSVMKRLYEGELLPKIISKVLQEFGGVTEECVISIFKLLDDGLTVYDLLDNSFICTIDEDDERYPGIWDQCK